MIRDEYMTFRRSDINISGNRRDTKLKVRKMKGNADYMYYLLDKYADSFDYITRLEMCKMLYRNYRPVYRTNVQYNLKYLYLMFNVLDLSDFIKILAHKNDH